MVKNSMRCASGNGIIVRLCYSKIASSLFRDKSSKCFFVLAYPADKDNYVPDFLATNYRFWNDDTYNDLDRQVGKGSGNNPKKPEKVQKAKDILRGSITYICEFDTREAAEANYIDKAKELCNVTVLAWTLTYKPGEDS